MEPGEWWPEVHHDDPQAVEGVVQDGGAEEPLHDDPARRGIDREEAVVYPWGSADEEDVDDVEDHEEPDRDPGDAVERPREHPLAAPVADQHQASARPRIIRRVRPAWRRWAPPSAR